MQPSPFPHSNPDIKPGMEVWRGLSKNRVEFRRRAAKKCNSFFGATCA